MKARGDITFGLKGLATLLILVFLYIKIQQSSVQWNGISQLNIQWIYVAVAIILVPINWGMEAKKWQILSNIFHPISFYTAIKATLAGLSSGILTPNRLGNFIGRLAFVPKSKHKLATAYTFLGNMAQFSATIGIGFSGFLFWILKHKSVTNPFIYVLISLTFLGITIGLYFYPQILYKKQIKWKFLSGWYAQLHTLNDFKKSIKWNVLLWSISRFFIFSIQYGLIILAFKPELKFTTVLLMVQATYVITTLVPSLFFGKLFVRESVALVVFSSLELSQPQILTAAFLLWGMNLMIPSIIGSWFWIKPPAHA